MGLSLKSLGKKIGDVLGGVERQVNPFDHGATYSNPHPQQPPVSQSVLQSVNRATGFAPQHTISDAVSAGNYVNPGSSILHGAIKVMNTVDDTVRNQAMDLLVRPLRGTYDAARLGAAKVTGNDVAAAHAQTQLKKDFVGAGHIAQQVLKTAPEIGLTIADMKDQGKTYHPNSKIEQTLFGKTPVQDIQAKVLDTQKKHGNAAAFGEGALSLVQDLPVLTGSAKVALKGSKAVDALGESGKVKIPGKAPVQEPSIMQAQGDPELSKNRYQKTGKVTKAKEAFNPYQAGAKIDAQYAKTIAKVPQRDIPKTESLEALAETARNSSRAADQLVRDSSIGQVIRKYGNDTPASKQFNTYRVALRDLEQRSLGGRSILPTKTEDLTKMVNEYEAINPAARQEVAAINKQINDLQDSAVQVGHLDPEHVAAAREKSPNFYTPISRAIPEEVERASMNSRSVGSIAKQSLLQDYKGSDIPVDTSFSSLTDYVHNAVREVNKAKLAQKYAERVKQGVAPGRFTDTVENIKTRKEFKDQIDSINSTIKTLKSERNRTSTKARVALKDAALAGKDVKVATDRFGKTATDIRSLFRKITPDSDAAAAISKLNDKELVNAFHAMVENDTKGIETLRKRLVANQKSVVRLKGKTDASVQTAQDFKTHLQDLRDTIQGLRSAKSELRGNAAEFSADPTTGLQVVSGRLEGETYKIETTPEVARFLQGLTEEQLNVLLRGAKVAQAPFRTAFTGALNPVFAVLSASWNMVLAPIVSPQGFRIYGPKAIAEGFKSFNKSSELQVLLREHGAQKFTGNLATSREISTAEAVAAEKNLATRLKFAAKHPVKTWEKADIIQSKVENAQRTGIAKAAYDARLRKSGTEEQAIADAVYAYNNVLPNFGRSSALVRQVDGVLMYSNATVAGTRALLTAIKRDPIGTSAKLGALTGGMIAVTAYSSSQEKSQEFYDDMIKAKKGYMLDNNLIVVLPSAHKDDQTGEWTGIIKYPLPPEVRPLQHAIWEQMQSNAKGHGVPVKQYAMAMFDFVTGQGRTLSNPELQVAAGVVANKNLQFGGDAIDPNLLRLPKDQQFYSTTSEFSKHLASALHVSPAKVDLVLGNLGFPGAVAKKSDGGVKQAAADYTTGKFVGAKGQSDGAKHFALVDSIKKDMDQNEVAAFDSLHPVKKDPSGEVIYTADSVYNPAARLDVYNRFPKVFEADKQLDQESRKEGRPGNPLFDLQPWQVKKVLEKENLPPGAKDPELSNLFSQDWYVDYNTKRSQMFTDLSEFNKQKIASLRAAGHNDVADTMQKSQDSFDNPKNPYPVTPPDLQKAMDSYSALPKGTGRSGWIKTHPQEWAAMQNQFASIDDWQNKQRGLRGLAATEGKVGKDNGFPSYTASSGSSGGGSSSHGAGSAYKYAVSLNAGGSGFKPKVKLAPASIKGKSGKGVAKAAKPTVKMKKSMV
jgi:hypothetical protein